MLAAWLYSAYSATALGSMAGHSHSHSNNGHGHDGHATSAYDMIMPLLPDDSETCVNELGKALELRGVELTKPNETCDVVYCFCGIRLHHLTCPDSFSVGQSGELVGDASVTRLEKNCLSSTTDANGLPGLGGCSKCLNTLYWVSFPYFSIYIKKRLSFLSRACFHVLVPFCLVHYCDLEFDGSC